ncbi:hypothetical protein QEL91_004194 [Pseudomonas putida]|nr:hypothetical protein [Pseudomonas putida]
MLKTIQKSLPYVARVLSDSTGVQVVFGSDRAYTTGKKIFIPMVEPTSEGMSLTLGYLAHEAAHCRYSDFSHNAFSKDEFTNSIAGIVEDLWIEGKMLLEYPGVQKHSDTLVQKFFGNHRAEDVVRSKSKQSFHNFLLLFGRARVLGQAIDHKSLAFRFDSIFADGQSDQLFEVLSSVPLSASSQDNLRLAEELVAVYYANTDEDPSKDVGDSSPTETGSEDQADAQPGVDAQGQAEAQPDANADGQADAQAGADAQDQAEAQPDANADGHADAQTGADAQDQAEAQPDANADGQADAQAGADAKDQADAQPDANADGQADAQTGADAQDQAEAQPDANADGQADAQTGADAQDQAEAQPDANADGQADAQADADAQDQADAQPDANADGQADAQTGADAQDQADAQPDANANGQADAQAGANAQDQAAAQPDAGANGEADAQPSALPETYIPELGSCIGDLLQELASQNTSTLPSPMTVSAVKKGDPDKAFNRYQVGRLNAAGIRQAFRSVFQGRLASQVFHRDSGRHLDRNKLARVPAGQRDVFIHRTEKADVNCAIQFLVDVSFSMANSVSVAETALMGMLESLEGLKGITTGAMAFPTSTGEAIKLKSHKERFKSLLGKGNFGLSTHGSTPLAEALWPAAIQLLQESDVSARKILIIVTDGDPDSPEKTVEMTKLVQDSGIDVYCLGFGTVNARFLTRCFGKKGIDVQLVENLSKSLFKVLKNNI